MQAPITYGIDYFGYRARGLFIRTNLYDQFSCKTRWITRKTLLTWVVQEIACLVGSDKRLHQHTLYASLEKMKVQLIK